MSMWLSKRDVDEAVDSAVTQAAVTLRREVSDLLPVIAEQENAVTIVVQSINVTINVGFADGGGGGGATHCGDASIVFGTQGMIGKR
jgi:hypothetical protein